MSRVTVGVGGEAHFCLTLKFQRPTKPGVPFEGGIHPNIGWHPPSRNARVVHNQRQSHEVRQNGPLFVQSGPLFNYVGPGCYDEPLMRQDPRIPHRKVHPTERVASTSRSGPLNIVVIRF